MGASTSTDQAKNEARDLYVDKSTGGSYTFLDFHPPSGAATLFVVVIVIVIFAALFRSIYKCHQKRLNRRRNRRIDEALTTMAEDKRNIQMASLMSHKKLSQSEFMPSDGPA